MTKRLPFFLLVAIAAAGAGFGANLAAPAALRATDAIAAPQYGNVYTDPDGVPKQICICRDNATECDPCRTLTSAE
ncbi:MAG TPA: hypothetical protein VF746_23235 [Longimicrobium sp.]|jgi:hypothetical protein